MTIAADLLLERDRAMLAEVARTVGSADAFSFSATGDAWDQVARGGVETALLDLAETEGMTAVTVSLDARGLG